MCISFVLIFPGRRCDENDTLNMKLSCDSAVSWTVAIGAQAVWPDCGRTVNAVSACWRVRAAHHGKPLRRALPSNERAHPVVEALDAWMDCRGSPVLCSLKA